MKLKFSILALLFLLFSGVVIASDLDQVQEPNSLVSPSADGTELLDGSVESSEIPAEQVEPDTIKDYNSVAKYNFIFYFLYKYKYDSGTELKSLEL